MAGAGGVDAVTACLGAALAVLLGCVVALVRVVRSHPPLQKVSANELCGRCTQAWGRCATSAAVADGRPCGACLRGAACVVWPSYAGCCSLLPPLC
jgi:hypothetical protein